MQYRKYAPLPAWQVISGVGRSKSYELLSDGKLRGIKVGRRLLIDVEAGLAFLATMPTARIQLSPRRSDALPPAEISDAGESEETGAMRTRGPAAPRSAGNKTP